MKCVTCGEEVVTAKIGDDNWSAGCECWTAFSITPGIAQSLYLAEVALRRSVMGDVRGFQKLPATGKLQTVGPADC